tara:strand:- start:313 stop:1887 length:1575 start_codon:yes stop_codon:yes gene_type:complete
MLRDYQQRTIDRLYNWFSEGCKGHPCIELPTGSGKSHIVAELCKDALQNWPDTRVLMLTHVKELIEQNAEKMLIHWPDAPLGIYSAGMRRRELDMPITFAGIQSVRKRAKEIGHIDLVIVDECHLISHKQEGGYWDLIADLIEINPKLRVIGLTATPYRLGHGLITEEPALFSDLIKPTSIEELIAKGYLSPLRSKLTKHVLSTDGVHKRGGEYIESELQAAIDNPQDNVACVDEVIKLAGDRKSWLFFCVGVAHAEKVAEYLNECGITAACITGGTGKSQREDIIKAFKAGEIKALTNANVLTTGFDYPNLDLIAMLRPTMSVSLYVQMVGRGMRIKDHTDHCLLLDFAGAVSTHGPITCVNPGKKAGEGEAPVKVCPECDEIVALSAKECPACGYAFPPPPPKKVQLHDEDVMGINGQILEVTEWEWRNKISYTSGKPMVTVTYYGDMSDTPVTEYLTVEHEGRAGEMARRKLGQISVKAGVDTNEAANLDDLCWLMNAGEYPKEVEYRKDGKFFRVLRREW